MRRIQFLSRSFVANAARGYRPSPPRDLRSFDLCADGGIRGLNRRFRPQGGASADAKKKTANCSLLIGSLRGANLCGVFMARQIIGTEPLRDFGHTK
jgi:hypothetical protein